MSDPPSRIADNQIIVNSIPYVDMSSTRGTQESASSQTMGLTSQEITKIRSFLAEHIENDGSSSKAGDLQTVDSRYEEFSDSTHAWAIFAEDPTNQASGFDRGVGCAIICLQMLTYWLFAAEAVEDYRKGVVPVSTTHYYCGVSNEQPQRYFSCEADTTHFFDVFVSFCMLGIFLASDVQQAWRAIMKAPRKSSAMIYACFAGVEVIAAFLASTVTISQKLYIGEVSDGIEAGIGLLFVRELSSRAYAAIRHKKKKQYVSFFCVLGGIIFLGIIINPICESLLAP